MPEVLKLRLDIYQALEKWGLMEIVAHRLVNYDRGGRSLDRSLGNRHTPCRLPSLSSRDVVTGALDNIVFPSGNAKIGTKQYPVDINTSPALIDFLNELPIKTVLPSRVESSCPTYFGM